MGSSDGCTNFESGSTNLLCAMIFFFNWRTEKKNLVWTNKKLVCFSTAHTEKSLWKKFVKQIGENI
jgi:hypothetical protein